MIYVVRHGQTDWNKEKRIAGRRDISLNEVGISQAKITAEKLKEVHFDVVFSSPLKRTMQTAEILTNQKIQKDERIIERSNGDLEGKLHKDVPTLDYNDPKERRFNIETITDFRARIRDFWEDITKNYQGKNVLVVTHAGVTIYTKCFFEGEPKDGDYDKLKLNNCEVLTYDNEKTLKKSSQSKEKAL